MTVMGIAMHLFRFKTVKTCWQSNSNLKVEKLAGRILVLELIRNLVLFTVSVVLFHLVLNLVFGIPRFSNFLFYIIFMYPFALGIFEIIKFARRGDGSLFTFDKEKSLILKDNITVDSISNISNFEIKKQSSFSFYTPYILSLKLKNKKIIMVHQSSSKREITSLLNELNLLIGAWSTK